MAAVIEIVDLHKHFGRVPALDGLSLQVNEGEIHGFLGPNGAGKTTTMRVLLGAVRSTSGEATLFGRDPWREAVALHREIAYVPDEVTLWPSLTGGETIDLLARIGGGLDQHRRDELIKRFDLDPRRKIRTYSRGNRQKVALIAAFATRVRLLLLDEPSSGLDPLMEHLFRECVREARDRGVTIFLSSHILSEVEALCDRVTIIRSGRTVESGSLDSMRHLNRLSITAELLGNPRDLMRLNGVDDISIEANVLHAQVDPDSLNDLIRTLARVGVRNLVSQPPTLEELFMRHYGIDQETGGACNGESVRS